MHWSASENFRGHLMTRFNDSDEIKVTMALAAWHSFSRFQQETNYWQNLFEQRLNSLSEAEEEEFLRLKEQSGPSARIQSIRLRKLTIR
ncbi:MAG: hypothetical protein BZY88_05670 [SAR202 cluster bacterium Io17-Chloro-G9]|nr:MAG: hypothetical protein BZY88_05670 [SAR202 cluster bacterium Io17-Chloro-G9]